MHTQRPAPPPCPRSAGGLLTLLLVAATSHAAAAQVPVSVLVRAAARAALSNSVSVAATFAVAHSAIGTGGAGSGACYDEDGPRIFGSTTASCHNSDVFGPHATPIGDDHADANASASSALLGGGTANSSPTHISKGDFAAAGAFARSGFQISVNAAIPAGAPGAAATITLPGGSTITASKDPENTFFGVAVTDLGLTDLNGDLLGHMVGGLSFASYLPDSVQPRLQSPAHIYWALLADLHGGTGQFTVQNFGSLVSNPLTAADFVDVSTPDSYAFELPNDYTFTLDIPTEADGPSTQSLEIDASEVHVGAVPEPSSVALLLGGVVAVAVARHRRPRTA